MPDATQSRVVAVINTEDFSDVSVECMKLLKYESGILPRGDPIGAERNENLPRVPRNGKIRSCS